MPPLAVEIRRGEVADAEAIHATFCGPSAIAGTLQIPYPSVARWREHIAEIPIHDYLLVACVDGRVVGNVGLHQASKSVRRRHVGTIGMAVSDEWQGKGIGTALMRAAIDLADNWFDYRRLELSVFVNNEPAVALYRKAGFVVEGTAKAYAFCSGEYVDALLMARVKIALQTR